jgi:hypothetical protein
LQAQRCSAGGRNAPSKPENLFLCNRPAAGWKSGSNAYYGIGRHLASKHTFSEDRNHPHNRVSRHGAMARKL